MTAARASPLARHPDTPYSAPASDIVPAADASDGGTHAVGSMPGDRPQTIPEGHSVELKQSWTPDGHGGSMHVAVRLDPDMPLVQHSAPPTQASVVVHFTALCAASTGVASPESPPSEEPAPSMTPLPSDDSAPPSG